MEGIWSGLRNFLDHFKGISQRFLHLRVARDEFLHNHGHGPWRQTFEVAVRCIFSTTGDYWRWMAHQHRRNAANALLPMSDGDYLKESRQNKVSDHGVNSLKINGLIS